MDKMTIHDMNLFYGDFQALKNVVVSKKREEKLEKWIQDKIASTYVRISPDWRGCDFKYKGWIK